MLLFQRNKLISKNDSYLSQGDRAIKWQNWIHVQVFLAQAISIICCFPSAEYKPIKHTVTDTLQIKV